MRVILDRYELALPNRIERHGHAATNLTPLTQPAPGHLRESGSAGFGWVHIREPASSLWQVARQHSAETAQRNPV
jgi:hypothetical protein